MNEEYLKHVDFKITKELESFIYDNVLEYSEYAVMRKEEGKVIAYCTRCNKEYETWFEDGDIIHNHEGHCHICGARVKSKNIRYGRKTLEYRTLIYTFDKSLISKNHIVCKAYEITRDGYEDYKKVKTDYYLRAVYIFGEGESAMLSKQYGGSWLKRSSIFDINNIMGMFWTRLETWMDFKSFDRAVKGTSYQYAMLEVINKKNSNNTNSFILKYLELFTKNNLVESMMKIRCTSIIVEKIENRSLMNVVNWKGKDIYKILKTSKEDLRVLIKSQQNITIEFLKVYQIRNKSKSKLTIHEIKDIEMKYHNNIYKLENVIKYAKLDKIYRYLNKQKLNDNEKYAGWSNVLITFSDYIADCKILNQDLKNERILFPKELWKAHQNTIAQVTIKKDPEVNKLIKKRYKKLIKYSFEYKGMEIRPVKDVVELIREGKELGHCVGGYAKRHAKGETNIFVIRNKEKPLEPFFTVEIKNEKVIQIHGKCNCNASEEIKEFIEKFKIIKLNIKIKKVA
ncbi:MAG: PcfJ domain-containing protein [Clostridium sp.]